MDSGKKIGRGLGEKGGNGLGGGEPVGQDIQKQANQASNPEGESKSKLKKDQARPS